ncbi:MAG: Efflux transporter, RND family, MFP subunit [Candidatus Falkowbacteria bacterium GW2011_GWC2_38_22]|uniref:Efflux transporter, RND family, MFP subunit n=1 Tax=Candidatus Falkowbacteria bacterium GW2011_GWE1_38_31 TaxID=1618638 RepID=A0A0G0JTV2_9BACT|nr:MAG: Efflux transporter, RND family, MFP subunit [Candidatus Falkowbacteria bacterium GW2011_GWF2_38_1205]KKQ62083.1 MAG: Efflux transporter, RND family, MFP subunit [Candidatus Falkowbacteria bacterium GW2011_GWC2_38_22]KKQ64233.1 MAG: Efflux transporter, RND family, MFP subunit [Candidatus Falkowbacteria bacterium GW2011_GWF1_38_22]KKQ66210.1 MAG: Efflux transporter, RND family, MFP subunit [Candidatus Falkowbacteria bacterium GW2011_GWE2_38_254]KKQ70938.1 MAG: Efflux transporter, RND fami
MKKTIYFILIFAILLSGCAKKEEEKNEIDNRKEVKVQTYAESKTLKQSISYPALVYAEQEAKIVAKMSGTVRNVKFNNGDSVRAGQELARIDDANSSKTGSYGFNDTQVRQAQVGVSQAAAAYALAEKNYQNLLLSSQRDLEQAKIAKLQSTTGKDNLGVSSAESLKSAELAYETAVLARENAKINLDKRRNISGQNDSDALTNAGISADSVANTCAAIINSINNITNASDNISISYENNLGALDFSALPKLKTAYEVALSDSKKYSTASFSNTNDKLALALSLAEKTKALTDAAKYLFEKTITSADLPQSALAGNSLSGLQSAVAGYQSQASGAINQINGAKQGLINTELNNDSTLASLQKAYELALKQEESAKQNLENLKIGNKSALDNAGFGVDSSLNQYDAIKIRIDSQISSAKSQMDIASLSYNNALLALQGLYDVHLAVSPIDGVITRKNVSEGETVSPGQILATVSFSEKVKLQIFASQEDIQNFSLGQSVNIFDNNNKSYKGLVSSITEQADSQTKRFLVEIKPEINNKAVFILGTVMNVAIDFEKKASDNNTIILPLSAIEVGQNGSYIMTIADGKVKKVLVEIKRVSGESAEIKAELAAETEIIVEGNKLVAEGEEVRVLD